MEQLDQVSWQVFSSLRAHERVVQMEAKDTFTGAATALFTVWEQKHAPCVLPADLKRFYSISNGLSVKWFVNVKGTSTLVGHFLLNPIQDITRIPVECNLSPDDFKTPSTASASSSSFSSSGASDAATSPSPSFSLLSHARIHVFYLESNAKYGDVALVFLQNAPQVWFRDRSGAWNFLAHSFADYYRLMVTHLGIISWQNLFSPACPVDPVRKPWFYFFIPYRIAMQQLPQQSQQQQQQQQKQPPRWLAKVDKNDAAAGGSNSDGVRIPLLQR